MARIIDRTVISLDRQAESICKKWPDCTYNITKSTMELVGYIQPTAITCRYKYRITYKITEPPKVWIIEPELIFERNGQLLEHAYHEDKRPCVFRPRTDWNPKLFLGENVIPWLATWLVFYEIWLSTGEWLGGGYHPDRTDDEDYAHGQHSNTPNYGPKHYQGNQKASRRFPLR